MRSSMSPYSQQSSLQSGAMLHEGTDGLSYANLGVSSSARTSPKLLGMIRRSWSAPMNVKNSVQGNTAHTTEHPSRWTATAMSDSLSANAPSKS